MSALEPLANPTERIAYLPDSMNWRGSWSATTQYYVNDVVVSPTNGDCYLTNRNTLGGVDPALSPAPSFWTNLAGTATGTSSMSWKGLWSGADAYDDGSVVESPTDFRTYVATQSQPAGGADPATGAVGWALIGPNGGEFGLTQLVGAPNVPAGGTIPLTAPYTLLTDAVYFVSLTVEATNAVALAADDQLTIAVQPSAINVGNQTLYGNVGGSAWAGGTALNATFSGVVKVQASAPLSITYNFLGTNSNTYTFLNTNRLVIFRLR